MATPNYGYEKRQRELAKKKKKEEKLRAKSQRPADGSPLPDDDQKPGDVQAGAAPAAPAGDSQ